MERLDRQALLLFAVELDLPDLLNFCNSSKRIDDLICKRSQIWIDKLKRDYNFVFLGVSSKDRNPEEYYKALYILPPSIEFKY